MSAFVTPYLGLVNTVSFMVVSAFIDTTPENGIALRGALFKLSVLGVGDSGRKSRYELCNETKAREQTHQATR